LALGKAAVIRFSLFVGDYIFFWGDIAEYSLMGIGVNRGL